MEKHSWGLINQSQTQSSILGQLLRFHRLLRIGVPFSEKRPSRLYLCIHENSESSVLECVF